MRLLFCNNNVSIVNSSFTDGFAKGIISRAAGLWWNYDTAATAWITPYSCSAELLITLDTDFDLCTFPPRLVAKSLPLITFDIQRCSVPALKRYYSTQCQQHDPVATVKLSAVSNSVHTMTVNAIATMKIYASCTNGRHLLLSLSSNHR